MAIRSEIEWLSSKVDEARENVVDAISVFGDECKCDPPTPLPENRDQWSRLKLEAVALQQKLEQLLLLMTNKGI